MHADTEPDPQNNARQLWRVLRHYLEHTCALIGMPARIAQKLWLTRAEHAYLLYVLRPLEILLRRLIYLEASELAATPPKAEIKQRPPKLMPTSFGAGFDLDHPETWRTRFKLTSSRRSPRTGSPAPAATPANEEKRLCAAAAALRLEALIRGFNDPAPLARRLARRLHQNDTPIRAVRLPKRVALHPLAPSLIQAGELCAKAHPSARFADSS